MHKTVSLNFDGTKNPRKVEQKDRSVDAQDFEGSQTTRRKQKSNKLLLWCAKCCGKRKKKTDEGETEKRDKKKPAKKSIFKRLKKSRCWGRRKRKDKDSEREDGDEKRDSGSYESRAGTSARDSKGRLIVDKSDSGISFEERRRPKTERSQEKRRKAMGRDLTRSGKSVSYADTRDVDKSREKKCYARREKYDESLRDITKSCCYLCTKNSLAIAAAMAPQPVLSDKSVEVDVPEMLEKSCSPIKLAVHVRTVKSLVRVKIRDTCTSYAGVPEDLKPMKVRKKRRKFRIFPKIKRTECPVRRTVGCVTENTTKATTSSKPKEKRKFQPCCKDKAV